MLNTFAVKRIIKYAQGPTLASINFQLGPVVIRGAHLFEHKGKRWLGMPGRLSEADEWGDLVYFLDRELKAVVEEKVIAAYQAEIDQTASLPA